MPDAPNPIDARPDEERGMAAATIRDVARHAAVSVASVSRALNGAANVHPDTRARVQIAAKALGYVPHAGARSLSTARSHAIGVVLPDLHGEFFSEMVRGIDREASARGYQLLLSNIHADPALAAQAIRAMRGRVDGLIVMAPQISAAVLDESLPGGLATVLVNSPPQADRHAFGIDNRDGAIAMTRHLIAQGRRRIVHISGDLANIDARERAEGYRAALGDLPAQVIEGDFQEPSGARAAAAILAGDGCDAIFAANDMMALGALQALREAGVAVPGQIAVAGFDDIPLARYLGLTTMRVDMAGMGARAVSRLADQIAGKAAPPAAEALATTLVVRATTG